MSKRVSIQYSPSDNKKIILTEAILPIDSLYNFIESKKHLPNVPSTNQIKSNNGKFNVGELQFKMLKNIEELTLYGLQLKQENEILSKRIVEKTK